MQCFPPFSYSNCLHVLWHPVHERWFMLSQFRIQSVNKSFGQIKPKMLLALGLKLLHVTHFLIFSVSFATSILLLLPLVLQLYRMLGSWQLSGEFPNVYELMSGNPDDRPLTSLSSDVRDLSLDIITLLKRLFLKFNSCCNFSIRETMGTQPLSHRLVLEPLD